MRKLVFTCLLIVCSSASAVFDLSLIQSVRAWPHDYPNQSFEPETIHVGHLSMDSLYLMMKKVGVLDEKQGAPNIKSNWRLLGLDEMRAYLLYQYLDLLEQIRSAPREEDIKKAELTMQEFFKPDAKRDSDRFTNAMKILMYQELLKQLRTPPSKKELEIVTNERARIDILLAKKSSISGKVAAYKFSSNDGWIVTPEECTTIADSLRHGLENVAKAAEGNVQDDQISIREWLMYYEFAAQHGGYRVR